MSLVWLALFGGAAAWSLQLVLSYAVVALGCGPANAVTGALDALGGVTAILNGISVLAGLGAAGSALAGFIVWRGSGDGQPNGGGGRSLAAAGVGLDLLFLLVILTGASAPLLMPPCAG